MKYVTAHSVLFVYLATCEMAKMSNKRKIIPINERVLRQYHADVRRTKKQCDKMGVKLLTYSEAKSQDVCILSRNEYDLMDIRKNIFKDNESYFLTPEDYEKMYEEE